MLTKRHAGDISSDRGVCYDSDQGCSVGHGDTASSSLWLRQTPPKMQKQSKELGNERSQQG